MKIWFRIWKNAKLIRDLTVVRDEEDTRTHKIMHSIEEASHVLDLSTPVWLDKNIRDFKHSSRCRFYQDNFMEPIDFDYLEISVLEEDGGY